MWYFVPLISTKNSFDTMRYKEKSSSLNGLIDYLENTNKFIHGQIVLNNIIHENELDINQFKFIDQNNRIFIEFNHIRELKELIKKIREKGFAESRFDKIHLYGEGWFIK
jgi:hypothetical protein